MSIQQRYSSLKHEQPVAEKQDHILIEHGDSRNDEYYWMRLSDDQKNAESKDDQTKKVLQYLESENFFRDKVMGNNKSFQETLYDEIISRIKKTDMSVPYFKNGYFYITRFEADKEYPIYTRKKSNLNGKEEMMLDVNQLSQNYEYYNVGGMSISPDNSILAFGEDTVSRRIYTLRFKNLQTGEFLEDRIEATSGNAVWAKDNKTIFYAKKDPVTLRQFQVFKHIVGTDSKSDKKVYEETDETFYSFVYKTKSQDYIVIGSSHTLTNEYRVLPAIDPNGSFRLFQKRNKEDKLEYNITHFEDKWFIRTNHKAQNFRLMQTSVENTALTHWEEVIKHRENVLLQDVDIFRNFMVLSERKEGLRQLRVIPWKAEGYYIKKEELASMIYSTTNLEFDTDVLRFAYQSMTTPSCIYDFNMRTKERNLKKQQEVLGSFKSSDYTSEWLLAPSRDGTMIPISVVYHKTTKKDGSAPCLQYAYGSYGSSMDPYYSSARLSLLDRGFIYAIAHIRGGQEMGRKWYEDGKLLKKKNTFYDFIDCGKFLIDQGIAKKDGLYAMGGSAGGLLIGAVINMEPTLWNGAVAAVPFVDVVTTMFDESIPLTTFEFDEWGNPRNKKYYDYMKSYSPYDNIESKEYPSLLVTTGYFDSQVQYWEPAKWVAKLRDKKTDENPLLMYCDMETGHGGASGRFKRFKETALEYSFLLALEGLAK